MLGFWNYTVWATYTSLASAVLGIYFACSGYPLSAIICLIVSGFCDAFDGRIARTRVGSTEQEKRFGIQLDSLCDLVCFGILPVTIGYAVGLHDWYYMPVFLLFILAALIRLAYFNVMAEEYMAHPGKQSTGYLGLPVTSTALILPAVYLLRNIEELEPVFPYIYGAALLLIAAAFVLKFHVPKPGLKAILVMLIIGLVEFMALIVWGK